MMTEYTKTRDHLAKAAAALNKELDDELAVTARAHDPECHSLYPWRVGSAKANIKAASYNLHKAERQAISRESALKDRLADAVMGWICDLIKTKELHLSGINRFIRDMGSEDLERYSSLTWETMLCGRTEGDLLVGRGEYGPVAFDLLTCERIHDEALLSLIEHMEAA